VVTGGVRRLSERPVPSQLGSMRTLLLFALAVLGGTSCARAGVTPAPVLRLVTNDHGTLVNGKASASAAPGVRHIRLRNDGTEPHEAMFVRLPPAMTPRDYVAAVAAGALFPAGAIDQSGPGLTAPGDSVDLWLPLDPGTYVLICWNKSHATELPPAVITVAGAPHDDVPPAADATITMHDHHFTIDRPIASGERVLEIVNVGRAMHEMDILELQAGATLAEVVQWREGEGAPTSAAPAIPRSGALDAHDRTMRVRMRRTLRAGRHVLYCGMPLDSTAVTGQPFRNHADAGMLLEFRVQ